MRANIVLSSLSLLAGCYEVPPPGNPNPVDAQRTREPDPTDDDPAPPATPPVDPPEDPREPPPGPTARALFDADVAPVLQARCATSACHGGAGTSPLKFAPAALADYYRYVVGYERELLASFDKAAAPLIHRVDPGPHYAGVSYTPAEVSAMGAWLDQEREERSTPTTPPGPPPDPTPGELSRQLLSEWSGCMELAAWNREQVAREWATLVSGEGPCVRCHINGQGGFLATDESERMFDIVSRNRYYMLAFFAPNVTDPATARVEINRSNFARVASGEPPHIEHPRFDEDGRAMRALARFHEATAARRAAGTCDPPRLAP